MQALTGYRRYNPYTEPSMEIFSYHKGLNKLIEIGNSGIFRPEMLEVCSLFLSFPPWVIGALVSRAVERLTHICRPWVCPGTCGCSASV